MARLLDQCENIDCSSSSRRQVGTPTREFRKTGNQLD
jgi:hypothetical protein